VSTSELVDELMARCTPAVFIGHRLEEDRGGPYRGAWYSSTGNTDACIGICYELLAILKRKQMIEILEDERFDDDE
jgi:hypothetical protein